jgi:hypothetical protein
MVTTAAAVGTMKVAQVSSPGADVTEFPVDFLDAFSLATF